jgi:rubrerythrin
MMAARAMTAEEENVELRKHVAKLQQEIKWIKVMTVHGRWEEPDNFDLGFWQCSNCGFLSEAAAANRLYRYCCNCGAKMDGRADDGSERRSAGE